MPAPSSASANSASWRSGAISSPIHPPSRCCRRRPFTSPADQSPNWWHRGRKNSAATSRPPIAQAPLKIVRGTDVWLIDHQGRGYLDCYNNVAQIGHCHPKVVAALANQAAILNTNTRYLHDNLIDYADRLTASLPDPLSVCYFVCSGSEANDLAVRMAKSATGRRDFIVIDWAYHGHTEPLIDLSPYKYKRSGGGGRPAWVHEVPLPDAYRAPADWPRDEIGRRYAAAVREVAERLAEEGRPPAAFWAESLPSCGGQIVLPDGYLRDAYRHARAAGALTLADEVQVGFGRTGMKYWEFQRHGVVPDFVAMGKPIGAGHPMAALVTTADVATAFANGMEYFNTFGGNPVAAAVGLAVLDVIDGEGLVDNARAMGAHLLAEFRGMMQRYPFIGDVRGEGLFLGIDIVTDRASKTHDGARANRIANRARDLGVLFGTDGPYDNVIKLRPPLTFKPEHAALLVEVLEQCFAEELARVRRETLNTRFVHLGAQAWLRLILRSWSNRQTEAPPWTSSAPATSSACLPMASIPIPASRCRQPARCSGRMWCGPCTAPSRRSTATSGASSAARGSPPTPARCGSRTKIACCHERFDRGDAIDQIAALHARTEVAIRERLVKLGRLPPTH